MKTAVVTGAGGQDGSYLVEFLLDKGYDVWALYRPSATRNNRMPEIFGNRNKEQRFHPIYGDLLDESTLRQLLGTDEFYHLAALSHVGESFGHPELTMQVNFMATMRILELLRDESPDTRFYFAGTSETLPNCNIDGRDHTDRMDAHSPYAVSKLAAQQLVRVYRVAYDMYAVNGIAFNHESPRRGPNFVTAKIVDTLKRYKNGGTKLTLGNDTTRDWHDARDTVRGMWLSLQQDEARDYTFASGEATRVSEFARIVCEELGINYDKAVKFKGGLVENRPWDINYLKGYVGKNGDALDWERRYSLRDMIRAMIKERGVKYV